MVSHTLAFVRAILSACAGKDRQLRERAAELELLYSLSRSVASSLDISRVAETVVSHLSLLTGLEKCALFSIDSASGEPIMIGHHGLERELLQDDPDLLARDTVGRAIRERKTVLAAADSDVMEFSALLAASGIGAVWAMPLLCGRQAVGALAVYAPSRERLSGQNAHLLMAIANLAAVAVRNASSYAELALRLRQLSALSDISSATNSTMKIDAIMSKILWSITDIFDARVSMLLMMDGGDELRLDACCGYAESIEPDRPLGRDPAVNEALAGGVPCIAGPEEAPQIFALVPSAADCQAVILPLSIKNGTVGVMVLMIPAVRPLKEKSHSLMVTFATQVTIAIENNQLYDSMERRINELTTLVRVVSSIASTLDLKFVLNTIMELAAHVMNGTKGEIRLVDEETGVPRIFSVFAKAGSNSEENCVGRTGDKLSSSVIRNGRPVTISDISAIEELSGEASPGSFLSYLGVPLICRGRTIGVLAVYCEQKKRFTESEVRLFWTFADQAAVVVNNAHLFDQVQNYSRQLSVIKQEVHHRVKNNLQTVADLLSLEMLQEGTKSPQEVMRNSINRVKSIAAVHDLLSHEDLEVTDLMHITQKIVDIAGEVVDQKRPVAFNISGDKIFLRSKPATSLALVLNELLINAVKHAFGDEEAPSVQVVLRELDGHIYLTIRDNGRGMPEGFDPVADCHLGLEIVRNLVERDLHGSLTCHNDGGTVWEINFVKDIKEEEFAGYGTQNTHS